MNEDDIKNVLHGVREVLEAVDDALLGTDRDMVAAAMVAAYLEANRGALYDDELH